MGKIIGSWRCTTSQKARARRQGSSRWTDMRHACKKSNNSSVSNANESSHPDWVRKIVMKKQHLECAESRGSRAAARVPPPLLSVCVAPQSRDHFLRRVDVLSTILTPEEVCWDVSLYLWRCIPRAFLWGWALVVWLEFWGLIPNNSNIKGHFWFCALFSLIRVAFASYGVFCLFTVCVA